MSEKSGVKLQKGHLGQTTPDPRNARKHNPKNLAMIEQSLRSVGAGRSIVTASDGTILAGNATVDAAAAAGMTDAIVIHTRGDQLIVHVRDDIESGSKNAAMMGLFDNRSTDLSEWDTVVLTELHDEWKDDPSFEMLWGDKEMKRLFGEETAIDPSNKPQLGDISYSVVVQCFGEEDQAQLMEELEAKGRTVKALMA